MTDTGDMPKGVLAIVLGADGYVWASHADFKLDAPGGCTLLEGQEARARDAVARKFLAAACNSVIADVLESYEARQILDRLVRQRGFRVVVERIGHDGAD